MYADLNPRWEEIMADKTILGVVDDHDNPQHQIELQLQLHPEVSSEEDLLLQEYEEIKRLEGILHDGVNHDD